ncbi:1-deoxy-D-xylulose-5-phosphate synthase [Spirochaetota bacterium]
MILNKINNVSDLRKLTTKELDELSGDVRDYIIDVISKNGGHLASSLGVVELTIALHYVFNTPHDKLIWDVGHQTYAHKILTGRKSKFNTIRKFKGLSGFPKIDESRYDTYNTGHSSTSLSLALGEAISRDLSKRKNKVIAVIGDGSLTGGMAFEALNHIGHIKKDVIIILNDNEHSISENVGALSRYLTRILTTSIYNKFRSKSIELTRKIPRFGESIYKFVYSVIESFKGLLIPGQLFEDMGVRYFGPIDGHDMESLIDIFENVKKINSDPKIIHVITQKGKGYKPAEIDPPRFHGIGPFDVATGSGLNGNKYLSYSEVAGKTLVEIAKKDKKIIAITAAMKLGTGLYEFEKKFPGRFFDVGIAEQHGVTMAGSLAKSGLKPFISIYSTFLQRAVDQLIHDIGAMNMPIKLLIDRAGVVGADGDTHHGLFDISLIRDIPNFVLLAPSNGLELRDMIHFASNYNDGPIAIRFPRGSIESESLSLKSSGKFKLGKIKRLTDGKDLAIFTMGDMIEVALQLQKLLMEKGYKLSVVNLLSLKPLNLTGVEKIIGETGGFITLENGVLSGGIGEYIISNIKRDLRDKLLFNAGFPDEYITHGSIPELFEKFGIDAKSLSKRVIDKLK